MPRNSSYDLHPEAQLEIEGAYRWYSERSADVAIGFISSISWCVRNCCPEPASLALHSTRRYLLGTFPLSVVYLDDPGGVKIVADAHHKRRPGHWKARL